MLFPEPMLEVVLTGPKERMEQYIDDLHELAIFQVKENISPQGVLKPGVPHTEAGKHSELLLKLRIIQERIKLDGKAGKKEDEEAIAKALDKIESIIHGTGISLLENTERKQRIEAEVKKLLEEKNHLEKIMHLGLELDELMPYQSLEVVIAYFEEDVKKALEEKKLRAALWIAEKDKVCALIYPKEEQARAKEVIASARLKDIKLLEIIEHAKGFTKDFSSFSSLISAYDKRIMELKKEIDDIDKKIAEVVKKHKDDLLATSEYLTIKVAKDELPQRMLVGETSFVLQGWVPQSDLKKLYRVSEKHGVSVIVVESEEEKPTKLVNPKPAKSFELLTRMYSLPRSDEVDPTILLWLVFPLFFGLIIGDIGYGLMLCLLALYLRNHRIIDIGGREVANVLLYSGISAIIFGFIFGEIFGLPFSAHGEHSLSSLLGIELGYSGLINKFGDIGFLINATIIAGYIHLLLAFSISIYLEAKHHKYRQILGRSGWIAVLTAFFIAVMRLFAKIPLPVSTYAIIIPLLAIGLLMVIAGEGFIAAIEFLSLFSNLLSYIRLFAVGVAKAGVAVAINALILPAFAQPYAILAIIAFFLIHFLLLLLGVLSAGLHSIRLNYVEFFTKFYEGGGFAYNPFGYRRNYTKRGGENVG